MSVAPVWGLHSAQMLMFGGLHTRVWGGAAEMGADLEVQSQLTSLVEDTAELRQMYKHLDNQLAVASEELRCTTLKL